jgi:hypothetical protein
VEESLDELRAVLEAALAQADAIGHGVVAATIVHAIDILDVDERERR